MRAALRDAEESEEMAEQLQQLSGDLQATRTEVATLQQAVGTMQGSIDTIAAQLAKPQQAGAVRAPMPEVFKGQGDDFPFFIQSVRSYCELTNVPVGKRVEFAVRCLAKGPAKVWAAQQARLLKDGAVDPADLAVFTESLSRVYDNGDRATKARIKLDKVYQGHDSLERYVERFTALVAEIEAEEDISEPEKLLKFKAGLKTNLRMMSLMDGRTGLPFTKLETLLGFLTRYDAALSGVQNVENGPRAASSDTRPQKRPRGPHGHGQLAAARPMVNPENQFGVPMVAAFGGFGPGQGYGRGFYPRMDGLPPGQRFDGRQRIPPYRICYICGKPGCESWMHRGDTRGMTYRDALVGGQSRFQGGQGQGQNGQNQGANRSDQGFYDRFAHGQGHKRGNKFGGRGRGRGR